MQISFHWKSCVGHSTAWNIFSKPCRPSDLWQNLNVMNDLEYFIGWILTCNSCLSNAKITTTIRSENYYKTFIVLTCLKCTSHYDTIKIPIMKFCILLGMVSNPTCGSWFYLNRDTSRDSYHAYRGVQHSSLGSNPRLGATAKTISTTKIKGSAHSYNLPFYYTAIFVKKLSFSLRPLLLLMNIKIDFLCIGFAEL